ncbi:hypothetical protein [Tranquillimonas alkanivorans]|uniref:Uncharacterized protein n=1 Tax=Tranquillimonas alkanivorans TaxID=441119 RepID=A0A1I5L139_9RHOB|nr:hypothetical protein [Tranquillimonas alkanivorans]SFO91007.1 hypothetical protein SAMN04488047_101410 [Tranquillimonas alkanivorans]
MTEQSKKKACDRIVAKAAKEMVEGRGAPLGMMIDRMLTFAAAQAVRVEGSAKTAEKFRQLADKIEAGIFAHLESGQGKGRKH